ncbi:hypothetical protein FQZ97_832990 [compost metagenome]
MTVHVPEADAVLVAAVLQLQGRGHHRGASVDLADAVAVGQAHAAQVGDVGALVLHGVHRVHLDARQVHRHQEQGQAGVFRCVRIGACEQETVIGQVRRGGENLLSLDQPVALDGAGGAGPGCENIGAAGRFAEAEAGQGLAAGEAGQRLLLGLLGGEAHDDLRHLVGDGASDALPVERLEDLLQGVHVKGVLATTTPFFRPVRVEQSGLGQLAVEARMVAVHRVVGVGLEVVGQVGLEEGTYFFGEARRRVAVAEFQAHLAGFGQWCVGLRIPETIGDGVQLLYRIAGQQGPGASAAIVQLDVVLQRHAVATEAVQGSGHGTVCGLSGPPPGHGHQGGGIWLVASDGGDSMPE